MTNLLIRMELLKASMKTYQLANLLGVHENTLIRKLRNELPEEEQNRIVKIIQEWSRDHER